MQEIKLTVILFLIIVVCIAGYLVFHKSQTVSMHPTLVTSPTTVQMQQCTPDQLMATITTEGAAGNIYGTLEITNTGKRACSVILGNTITAMTNVKNVTVHFQQIAPTETFILQPNTKVYSQVHYPNGPQCSSGVTPQSITFLYKTEAPFKSTTPQTRTLMIQACTSQTEKTVVDIWPLSKDPITP